MNNLAHASAALLLLLASAVPSGAQTSSHYSMERVSIASIAQRTGSAHFETAVIGGQESPAGAASFCNTGFVSSAGFWSVLGDLPVPILLQLAKSPADPSLVDLSWTGTDLVFQVYRDYSPADLLNPANLIEQTSFCSIVGDGTPEEASTYYSVIPSPSK